MLRTLLINPPSFCFEVDHLEPPLGLLYIAAAVREQGHIVDVLDLSGMKEEKELEKAILARGGGDLIGITAHSTNYPFVRICLAIVRRHFPSARVILGGPHPTALPEWTLKDSGCDSITLGEGEDAMITAINLLKAGKNLPPMLFGLGRENLDHYPLPAWDLVDIYHYAGHLKGEKSLSLISSRGCAHKCLDCNNVVMGKGMKPRFRTPDNIIREIDYLKKQGFYHFNFNDDTFMDHPQLDVLLYRLAGQGISFRIYSRAERLNPHLCSLLRKSGCVHISMALDSLNPLNQKFLNKQLPYDIIRQGLENASAAGIITRIHFKVGLPFDSDQSIRHYFRKAARLAFHEYGVSPLLPFPGTTLWQEPETWGYTRGRVSLEEFFVLGKDLRNTPLLERENMTFRDILRWIGMAGEMLEQKNIISLGASKITI